MERIKGVIEKVNSKPYNDTFIWEITVDGNVYSMFAEEFHYHEGDTITFDYESKGKYNNIKFLANANRTGMVPDPKDLEKFKTMWIMDDLMARVTLMRCAVDLLIKRGDLSDGEIFAQYARFCKICGLDVGDEINETNT